jgi:hypothetical protein
MTPLFDDLNLYDMKEDTSTFAYWTPVSTEESTTISDFFVSSSDPNVQRIQKLIFIDLLSHDKDVVTSALKRIQQLCEPSCTRMEQNRKRLYIDGAHAAILLALKKWCFCPVVTTICFRILHYGSTFKEFSMAVAKVGLLHTILTGMKSFPYHRLLQQAGCSVLYTMASKSTTLTKLIFAESDGLRLIVQAFQTFPTDAYLQKCACDAMQVFAERKSVRQHFRNSGMAEALFYSIVLDCKNEIDAYKLHEEHFKLHFLR